MQVLPIAAGLALSLLAAPPLVALRDAVVADRVATLTRASSWTLERAIPMAFPAHHPQGLVKIGDRLFFSSVEVTTPPRRGAGGDGFDRDTGRGVGHLFEATMDGRLVADVVLGEGTMYHPGGIDFDGRDIWVPVAEYRPNSRSIVYRVDPATRKAVEVFRFGDHLGGVACNTDDHTLHAVSWGSRWIYRFALDGVGAPDERGRAARHAARQEPVALRRLPGLQVRREAADALLGHRRRAARARASVRCRSAASISSIW